MYLLSPPPSILARTGMLAILTPRRAEGPELVGQLAIGLQTRIAAPEPARRRRRARSRRRRRLPFHTNGVGWVFQPSTVCSNQSMIGSSICGMLESLGTWHNDALHRLGHVQPGAA